MSPPAVEPDPSAEPVTHAQSVKEAAQELVERILKPGSLAFKAVQSYADTMSKKLELEQDKHKVAQELEKDKLDLAERNLKHEQRKLAMNCLKDVLDRDYAGTNRPELEAALHAIVQQLLDAVLDREEDTTGESAGAAVAV